VSRSSMMMSFVLAGLAALAAVPGRAQEATVAKSLHELEVKTLEGQPKKLSEFKGKVLLVVNVASECGLTPQYRGLQALHDRFKERGFSVLGFPSNEFGGQEPGDAKTIREFCETNYKVTFPLFEKVETKEGAGQSPVYKLLKAATNELPGWNFGKYLVDKDGKPVKYFGPRTAPDDEKLVAAIEAALGPTK
jgi:glutathione peroxidase